MPNTKTSHPPKWVIERLDEMRVRLVGAPIALKVWNEFLSAAEKRSLGNNLEVQWRKAGGIIGLWMKLHSLSRTFATIDLYDRLYGLVPDEKRRLLSALDVEDKDTRLQVMPGKPHWNRQRGELHWNGRRIRKVRLYANPSHVQQLLDAFESQGWPEQINDPLFGGRNQQRLHEAVFSLNGQLDALKFHVHQGGQTVSWSIRTSSDSTSSRGSRGQTARRPASPRRR